MLQGVKAEIELRNLVSVCNEKKIKQIKNLLFLEITEQKRKINEILFSNQSSTGGFGEITNEILEKFIFGNPNQSQKEILYSLDNQMFRKMLDLGLKYTNSVEGQGKIIINIEGENIIFDNIQPIQRIMSWKSAMNSINIIDGRQGIDKELMDKIIGIIGNNFNLLGLNYNKYWSITMNDALGKAWEGHFNEDKGKYIRLDDLSYPICIYRRIDR